MTDSTASTVDSGADDPRPAIEVDDVSISYRVRVDAGNAAVDLAKLVTGRRKPDRIIPALRKVSFEVPKGTTLAVIGRNGAGKSTLLRALSGVLPPEEGRITVRGRVNLLALGLGMNTALSGRQNIKLGGLAVGLTEDRVDEITDEIAEFAQLGEYIDLPMNAYSTGMRQRLGFSVAAHLDPEILLIDEALGGGDAGFSERVKIHMAKLCGEGRTIVLVTHGLSSVRSMATDAIWLHQGQVEAAGEPEEILNRYMRYCRLESLELTDGM